VPTATIKSDTTPFKLEASNYNWYSGFGRCNPNDPTSCSAFWGKGSDYNLVSPPKGHYLLKLFRKLALASS
jgi:hypothetical protein